MVSVDIYKYIYLWMSAEQAERWIFDFLFFWAYAAILGERPIITDDSRVKCPSFILSGPGVDSWK